MKYNKPRKDLIFLLNPLLLLLGLFLFFHWGQYFHYLTMIFWIGTVCVLIVILTPLGNRRLGIDKETIETRLPWQQWLSGIFLLELAMLGVYFGIAFLNGNVFPINTALHPQLFLNTIQSLLIKAGLFPWSLYAIITVGMGITAYREKIDAYMSNLLKPLSKQEPQGTISLIINISARRCTTATISITLLFFSLLLVSVVLSLHVSVITGFQYPALITTLVFLSISFMEKTKKIINQLFSRHIPTYLSIPLYCVCFAGVILISNVLAQTYHEPIASIPSWITQWIHYSWENSWFIFSVMWWICFTPLVAGFFTRLSKGYRARDVMLAILILPVMMTIYFILQNKITLPVFSLQLLTCQLIALISFLIFLPTLVNHLYSSHMILSYYPKEGITKHRDHLPFLFRITQFSMIAFFIYWVIGMNGISLLIFFSNYSVLISFYIIAIVILKKF